MKRLISTLLALGCTLLLLTPATFAEETSQQNVAAVNAAPTVIDWQLQAAHDGGVVSIIGPSGVVAQRSFAAGEDPRYVLGDLPDGTYTFELWAAPRLDSATRAAMAQSRVNGTSEAVERELRGAGKLPSTPMVQSGSFTVAGGTIVDSSLAEATDVEERASVVPTTKDQVIADDLIVQMSLCVGADCVNNESFGFDTIRLKENNLRIKFDDTSATGSFPNVDWQLTANDSTNGGANRFSIDDVTNGRVPFNIEANSPTNSLYVADDGNVGIGTSTPVLNLHAVDGNTPALRLEQNGTSGFTPQTWDVAGNETVFFVRDVTNGSKLPFKIEPNAATNSLVIDTTGNVGVGTISPGQKLSVEGGNAIVRRTDGGFLSLFLESTGGTNDASWALRANGANGGFTFTEAGAGTSPFRIFEGAGTGTLDINSSAGTSLVNMVAAVTITGSLTVNGTTVPDFVFEPEYSLKTLEEQRAFFTEHKHLPAVPKANPGSDGRQGIDVVAYQMGMLEELEKAHLYIQQLDDEVKAKAAAIADLQARLAKLEAEQN